MEKWGLDGPYTYREAGGDMEEYRITGWIGGKSERTIAQLGCWKDRENTESDANLIVTAVNACISVNPQNPQAVAESIKDVYEALQAILNATICDICYEDECGGESSCTKGKYGEPCACHNQIHRAEESAYKALAKVEKK